MSESEVRLAYLRPAQIRKRLNERPLVYVPVGPLEWHGPHLPMGVDPINAERVAWAVCAQTGGVVWPTLFWGTERERPPKMLRDLGLDPEAYIVGMDFPRNSLPSAYCHEETLGLLVREVLEQAAQLGARAVLIVNGHGAINHNDVLRRLAIEFTRARGLRVVVRMAMPQARLDAGTIAHAGGDETSLMMHYEPQTVSLAELPPPSQPIRYEEYAIVDGPGFEGRGRPDRTVEDDPRTRATAERGRAFFEQTVAEIVEMVKTLDIP